MQRPVWWPNGFFGVEAMRDIAARISAPEGRGKAGHRGAAKQADAGLGPVMRPLEATDSTTLD
jgi:hypothetical protein